MENNSMYIFDEAYRAVTLFYGEKKAERSGVRYMNHIDEGLKIMRHFDASDEAMQAYCIHPIIQSTNDLVNELSGYSYLRDIDSHVAMLAMEYRSTANMYLSHKVNSLTGAERAIIVSRLDRIPGLKLCLIADKVQNYKDFELYHRGKHRSSDELDLYFADWVHEILGVSKYRYEKLKLLMKIRRRSKWKQKFLQYLRKLTA
jgi:hypothetical protein